MARNQIMRALLIQVWSSGYFHLWTTSLPFYKIESGHEETFIATWHYTTFEQWLVDSLHWAEYGQAQVLLNFLVSSILWRYDIDPQRAAEEDWSFSVSSVRSADLEPYRLWFKKIKKWRIRSNSFRSYWGFWAEERCELIYLVDLILLVHATVLGRTIRGVWYSGGKKEGILDYGNSMEWLRYVWTQT